VILEDENSLTNVLGAVVAEYRRAKQKWPPFNSTHEGYAVLLEEVDELWEHVRRRPVLRDLELMRHEAIQVAAMAIRFASELCDEARGRK
jgi:hypothetical protein